MISVHDRRAFRSPSWLFRSSHAGRSSLWVNDRRVLKGIFWVLRSGAPGSALWQELIAWDHRHDQAARRIDDQYPVVELHKFMAVNERDVLGEVGRQIPH
jgi:hypothetical protein